MTTVLVRGNRESDAVRDLNARRLEGAGRGAAEVLPGFRSWS